MDFYAVLGLSRVATLVEIKRAYRRLARRYHPDINPGDDEAEARFKLIAEAYAILSDLDQRRVYDLTGRFEREEQQSERSYGFEGFDFSAGAASSAPTTFGDLFAEVLDSPSRQAAGESRRGADLHATLTVPFEDGVRGTERPVTVMRRQTCARCLGAGHRPTGFERCTVCQGAGSVRSVRGHMVFAKPCRRCGGRGTVAARCPRCNAYGVEVRSETVGVPVPPGTTDGAEIRLVGHGNAGLRGGPPGDLVVLIRVQPHAFFRREGDDLHVVVPVAVHEAALGARIDVPTLDGVSRLRIPAGTQSGQRFRLQQYGVPAVREGRRGDLVVEVRLVLPRTLDERSKELLRQFGELNSRDVRQDLLNAVAGGESAELESRT
jgi:molecular chaperone DnaJ